MSRPAQADNEEPASGHAVVVPLSTSQTARQTVDAAVEWLHERGGGVCHLVVALPYDEAVPEGSRQRERAVQLLDRAVGWIGEMDVDVGVVTEVLGGEEYLFAPRDYAKVFEEYVETHEIDLVMLDPEYRPGTSAPLLEPLEAELETLGVTWEEAAVERATRRGQLIGTASFDRLFALFWISFFFYLLLGDPTYWFDLVTGVAVAAVVSVSLSHVTFGLPPGRVESPLRTVRFAFYVPYLIVKIIQANIAISYVILHPSLPITPQVTKVNARVGSGLPLLALANSITLTPGTLTVRANDQRLVVHTLLPSAREDLFDGRLERAVRFVFYGRAAAPIATPRERGDAAVIEGDEV